MQRLGFLFSRRWGLFLVAVILLTWLTILLGQWQFNRLEDRRERNEIVLTNEERPAVPIEELLDVGDPVPEDLEWRNVSVTGTYLPAETVHVRYRTHDSKSGVQVVVPLRLTDGSVALVDRGWWPTQNRGDIPDDVPAPPSGEVEVEGWLRTDAEGDATQVVNHGTRAISGAVIAETLDLDVRGGFVQLAQETPEPEQSLTLPSLPELGEGPHFFYGLQWWLFGAMAVFGFCYLLYVEWRDARARTMQDGTVPSVATDTEDAPAP